MNVAIVTQLVTQATEGDLQIRVGNPRGDGFTDLRCFNRCTMPDHERRISRKVVHPVALSVAPI